MLKDFKLRHNRLLNAETTIWSAPVGAAAPSVAEQDLSLPPTGQGDLRTTTQARASWEKVLLLTVMLTPVINRLVTS